MNNVFKNVVKASAFAVVAVSMSVVTQTQSAQAAMVIEDYSVLTLTNDVNGGVTLFPDGAPNTLLDFFGAALGRGSVKVDTTSTGSFASLAGTSGNIRDVTNDTSDQIASYGVADFITLNGFTSSLSDNIQFNLTGLIGYGLVEEAANLTNLTLSVPGYASFTGQFMNVAGDVLGLGTAIAIFTSSYDPNSTLSTPFSGPWNMTITAFNNPDTTTSVPTPALLPGIFALGATAIRKRKQAAAV